MELKLKFVGLEATDTYDTYLVHFAPVAMTLEEFSKIKFNRQAELLVKGVLE